MSGQSIALPTPADLTEVSFSYALALVGGGDEEEAVIYCPKGLEAVARHMQTQFGCGWQVLPLQFFCSENDWAVFCNNTLVKAKMS